jgi:hypothetical protein
MKPWPESIMSTFLYTAFLLRHLSVYFNVAVSETAAATALRREHHFVPLPLPEFTSA